MQGYFFFFFYVRNCARLVGGEREREIIRKDIYIYITRSNFPIYIRVLFIIIIIIIYREKVCTDFCARSIDDYGTVNHTGTTYGGTNTRK